MPESHEKKRTCPQCGHIQALTAFKTLLHHLREPYHQKIKETAAYYFCHNPDCEIVYFDQQDNIFLQNMLRWPIGQKSKSGDRKICYCFDVSYQQVVNDMKKNGKSIIKDFVIRQTKSKNCACEIRNPSGKCCLANFPKA